MSPTRTRRRASRDSSGSKPSQTVRETTNPAGLSAQGGSRGRAGGQRGFLSPGCSPSRWSHRFTHAHTRAPGRPAPGLSRLARRGAPPCSCAGEGVRRRSSEIWIGASEDWTPARREARDSWNSAGFLRTAARHTGCYRRPERAASMETSARRRAPRGPGMIRSPHHRGRACLPIAKT